jgi:flagellar motor switch protein FliM
VRAEEIDMADEPLVSAEEVASVLSSPDDSNEGPPAAAAGETVVYSLRRPATIAPDDEATARERLEVLAQALAAALSRELGSEIELDLQGFQQQTAGTAAEGLAEPAWTLGFLRDGAGGAALILDPTAALTLVELALGGHGTSAADGREPTPLERRVLGGLAGLILPRLNKMNGFDFTEVAFRTGGIPRSLAVPGEMVGLGLLKLKFGDSEKNGVLAVTPGMLRSSDVDGVEEQLQPGPIAPLLEKVVVDARPVLGAGRVSLRDLESLKPDDLLRFEVDADRRIQLRVRGQGVFSGRIARDETGAAYTIDWRRGQPAGTPAPGAQVEEKTDE